MKKKQKVSKGGRGKKPKNGRKNSLSLSLFLSLPFSKLTLCQRLGQVRQSLLGEESVAPGVQDLGEGRGRSAEGKTRGDDRDGKEHSRDKEGKAQQRWRLGRHFFLQSICLSLSLFFIVCGCFGREVEEEEGGVKSE